MLRTAWEKFAKWFVETFIPWLVRVCERLGALIYDWAEAVYAAPLMHWVTAIMTIVLWTIFRSVWAILA